MSQVERRRHSTSARTSHSGQQHPPTGQLLDSMSAMDSRSASDSSFIFVDDPSVEDQTDDGMDGDLSSLESLSNFLPTLQAPHAFNWDDTYMRQIDQARHQRPDGRLYIDELLLDLDLDGKLISRHARSSCRSTRPGWSNPPPVPRSFLGAALSRARTDSSNLLWLYALPDTYLYPPTSLSELNLLLCAVLDAPHGDPIRTHSVIYYILLAVCDGTASTVPDQFVHASEFLIPPGSIKAVQGFYALDTGSWQRAITALCDPHVVPDWVSETLAVLATCPPIEQRASYVLSFWRLKGITLSEPDDLALVLDALCDATRKRGVVEAWVLQRQWIDEAQRDELTNRVLSRCFGDNSRGKPVAHHVRALLAQPFTSHEDALVDAFCRSPPSDNIAKTLAVDWRLSKLIAESRPLDALRFWSTVKATVPASEDRLRLLKAVQATLTEVQQNALALEEDVDIIPASNSTSKSAPEASTKTTSNLTQPAWQPLPVPTPAPLPRSLLSIPSKVASSSRPATTKAPSASDLPLSASPFLRREKPLVSSVDASSLGGVQKSMLLALREGDSSGHSPPSGSSGPTAADLLQRGSGPLSSAASLFGMSPMRESSVATTSLFGGSPARKPTLGGFGSIRQPGASSHYGKAREEPPSLFDGSRTGTARDSDADDDDLRMLSPPPVEASEADEEEEAAAGSRAGRSKPTSTSKVTSNFTAKRRTVSNGAVSGAGDKRRAVSTEAEDRPSSSVKVSSNKPPAAPSSSTRQKPPGAFPSGFESESHDEDDDGDDASQQGPATTRRSASSTMTTTKKKSVAKRSSARASSAAATEAPSTPKAKKGSSSKVETSAAAATPAQETPRTTAVRRSTRLQTPAKDDTPASVPTRAPRSTRKGGAGGATKGKGRRQTIDEDEEE